MRYLEQSLLLFFIIIFPEILSAQEIGSPVDYVNPFIGVVDKESNCTVGPQLPFGSVSPGPETPEGRDDGYDPEQPIRGFGQLHVSGTGWGKYGHFLVSPQVGKLEIEEAKHDSPKSDEKATPYYYRVKLDRYGVETELSPTKHSVIYQFSFPKTTDAYVSIDISHSIVRDIASYIKGKVCAGNVQIDSENNTITGYGRFIGGFGDGEYDVYFCAQFNKKFQKSGTWLNNNILEDQQTSVQNTNDRIGAFLNFDTSDGQAVLMKIAVSFRSVQKAQEWLDKEIPDWNFEKVKQAAKQAWNNELSKIQVEGGSDKENTIFYSAFYRCMLMPRDRSGDIHGYPEDEPLWDDHYAVWDTWRTLFPLMTLINPEMVRDNINAFLTRFKANGVVKDAFIAGNDMFRDQGGNNVDNIIADAYMKKVEGINWDEAYQLLKFDADSQRLGTQTFGEPLDKNLASYKERGWIPAGLMNCSVSLEYSYNDFCASEVAKGLGKKADYKKYLTRSLKWDQLWNPGLKDGGFEGFIGPKKADGSWINIDPVTNWNSWNDYFYEANSWTYTFFVPHDVSRLIKFCGGNEAFCKKLNYGFSHDLIVYWNEPAFLTTQLFHYAGRPDLSSYWTKKTMAEKYTEQGYPGNEDSGAMGSWYIFGALGFFPNAGQPVYFLNGPSFRKITVRLGNGKTLHIEAPNLSEKNIYVRSCTLNGKRIKGSFINHDQLMQGGTLTFEMTNTPRQ